MIDDNKLLTPAEVAEMLRVSAKTLANWRYAQNGPTYKKFGNRIFYRLKDIQSFEFRRTFR